MDSMEELCLCYYDILHAMHAQFRNMAPLHFAANSFSKARKDYSVIAALDFNKLWRKKMQYCEVCGRSSDQYPIKRYKGKMLCRKHISQ